MSWYKKIIFSQISPLWTEKWPLYLSKNFEILLGHNYNRYEPYLIGSPKYNDVYNGLSVNIGMKDDIYKIIFKKKENDLVSIIILNNQVLPSRSFDITREKPYDIVNEIRGKIINYSKKGI